jgi:hypothetical protein
MMDAVVTTPPTLDELAERTRHGISMCADAAAMWAEGAVVICEALAAARARFPDNQGFGQWFTAQDFTLSHQDRAAAIAMGRDLTRARAVLEKTERRSLRHIHDREFRLTHAGKTTEAVVGKTPGALVGKTDEDALYARYVEEGRAAVKGLREAEAAKTEIAPVMASAGRHGVVAATTPVVITPDAPGGITPSTLDTYTTDKTTYVVLQVAVPGHLYDRLAAFALEQGTYEVERWLWILAGTGLDEIEAEAEEADDEDEDEEDVTN